MAIPQPVADSSVKRVKHDTSYLAQPASSSEYPGKTRHRYPREQAQASRPTRGGGETKANEMDRKTTSLLAQRITSPALATRISLNKIKHQSITSSEEA
ncbi:hypothetical protein PTTG_11892 [Puccinia triticina 1-1 BBBD Race 1]|uniref:Uncharacterized protein n=1 Tax=Puccinia triticina (isolate 1-1 / race 1 (BBBD)) TaxID=630390 RepID=A0A180G7M1_PUCT1|nr:hypothetical protein PTTG_11892 [Puccinia triticina 1-1 BBBD Race 1]